MSGQILALVRDLLFASKITATAKSVGTSVRIVRDPAQLASLDGTTLIVDLNQAGALEAAAQWKLRTGRAVTGFVAHTDAQTITQARELGIDQVLARSAFVSALPELLAAAH